LRYQVFDPESNKVLMPFYLPESAVSYARQLAHIMNRNIGIRDLEASPGAVDLWSVAPDGTVKEITIKHDDPKREEEK